METCCDFCAYNEYDEDDEEYYCSVNMDEDDMARFVQSSYKMCIRDRYVVCFIKTSCAERKTGKSDHCIAAPVGKPWKTGENGAVAG